MSLARKVLAHVTRNPIRYAVGGVLALVFGGAYLYRRRQAKQLAGADLGATPATLAAAAYKQIAAADAHQSLSDYRQAADQSLFWKAAADANGAYLKGAYWLAVAARCAGAWTLATMARDYWQAGQNRMGSSDDISRILTAAADAIHAEGSTNPGAKACYAALTHMAKPDVIATVQQVRRDQSVAGKAKGTAQGAMQDVSDYAGKALDVAGVLSNGVRMLIGMDPAPGAPPDPWWNWKKWAIRGGLAAAVILGVRVMFAPEYHAAKAIVAKAGTAVQNPVAAIRAALTTSGV